MHASGMYMKREMLHYLRVGRDRVTYRKKHFLLRVLLLSVMVVVLILASAEIWIDEITLKTGEIADGITDETADETTDGTGTLEPVEIREYEGQMLSSIDDFRENFLKESVINVRFE